MPRKATKKKSTKKKTTRRKVPEGSKKFLLTPIDRIYLGEILPDRESRATLKLARTLRERLSLTKTELKETGYIESADGRVRGWQKIGRKKGITFSAFELEMIVAGFKKADEGKTLTDPHIDLMDVFVPEAKE